MPTADFIVPLAIALGETKNANSSLKRVEERGTKERDKEEQKREESLRREYMMNM